MGQGLLRFWLTFEQPVSQGAYLRHGLLLTGLKYAGDAALIGTATGRLWTPTDYLHSIPFLLATKFAAAPGWLMPAPACSSSCLISITG